MSDLPDSYRMEDLRHKLENPRLRAVLAPAVYHTTAELLAQICEQYRAEPEWRMLGCRSGEEIVGCLGLTLGGTGRATIRHIAVAPDRRGQGIGTAMIRHAVATFAKTAGYTNRGRLYAIGYMRGLMEAVHAGDS